MNQFDLTRMENPQQNRTTRPSTTRSKNQPVRTKKRLQKKSKSTSASPSAPKTKKSESPNWGKILSPKNMEDSLNTISTLRNFCKQCIRYVQQADGLLDTLYVTTNSLQESGLLKKLSESKGKNLNTGDLTTMLMALMNSPLGNSFFKRLTSGDTVTSDAPSAEASTAQNAAPSAQLPTPLPQASPQGNATPQAGSPSSLRPHYPAGPQQPPYGYPPGSMPM